MEVSYGVKAIILAAGYATRLYPLTKEKPKPLLMVGKKTIIDYLIQRLGDIKEIDAVYIVTNQKFYGVFGDWLRLAKSTKEIIIENDGSTTNENRLGAIGDIRLVFERRKIDDDIIVVAGDNMFNWGLKDFADFAKKEPDTFTIGAYDIGDRKKAGIYGIVEIDEKGEMVNFVEKPQEAPSSLIATGIYYFPKGKLGLIGQFLKVGNEKTRPAISYSGCARNRKSGATYSKEYGMISEISNHTVRQT
jgi:glucose-1-phosphate thymidylyltransferase